MKFYFKKNKIYKMVIDDNIQNIIDNWTSEVFLSTLMYQCDSTRAIIEKLQKLDDKDKCICQTYVIGLLKSLNNHLLKVYSTEEYLSGIDNLCQFYINYNSTKKENIIIKKSWMLKRYRELFF